ncbi:zeta toxin family protein [Asticcacaulis sp. BYS171W]|uniref:Zeta toxin family protein n=1 Tax=Asticcacaulis aquaticus TaxID=2984212 RepID=A0ABT5HZG7_9CAUL|nr:zeta toxin family protein [Asticcacaulis aquaticus]MDC7684816.1 zeta toxin family protein [Asticcacaulis aquaticus]
MPRCLIIAGPNGAGKTTFALKYLPAIGVAHFINADLIASGLSPFHPEQQAAAAARLFLKAMDARIEARQDFAFETTLSGKAYLKLIEKLKADGWSVELYYLALPSPEVSKRRVAERVAHGGHHIPDSDIERRFPRSLRNLMFSYRMAVNECRAYINVGAVPQPIFEQSGEMLTVFDDTLHTWLMEQAVDHT